MPRNMFWKKGLVLIVILLFICINSYELKKAPAGSDGFDAITQEEKTVQKKIMLLRKLDFVGMPTLC